MSSVAFATFAPATPPGPDPYRRTVARLSGAGTVARPRTGVDPLVVLVGLALLTGVVAAVRHGRAVDVRRTASALPQPPPATLGRPALAAASPTRRAVRLRVGETREFSVEATGDELHYRWTVDEEPVGSGADFAYAPGPEQIGRRRVAVAVMGPAGAIRQTWTVRVRPPQPPRIADALPAGATVDAVAGDPIRFTIIARTATPRERLRLTWLVDGMPAGKQESLTFRAKEPGIHLVRAVVASSLGAAATREWRVNVAAAAVPSVPVAVPLPAAEPPAEASAPKPASLRPEPAPQASAAPAADEQGVRSFLDRYAAAWRAHDVDTLRHLGQVTTDEQARTLRDYFAKVGDLEVEVKLVAVRADGDRTIVRFTRHDRFRDPLGRVIAKDSPPIERVLVTTPDGFRFANAGG